MSGSCVIRQDAGLAIGEASILAMAAWQQQFRNRWSRRVERSIPPVSQRRCHAVAMPCSRGVYRLAPRVAVGVQRRGLGWGRGGQGGQGGGR